VSGLLAGVYPAFYLSSFKPALAVKPGRSQASSKNRTRDALVVFQYSVATIIFLCAFVIFDQSKFLTTAKLGFDKDRVLIVHRVRLLGERLDAFMQELKALPGVTSASNVSTMPGRHFDDNGHRLEGDADTEEHMIYTMASDADFVDVFGLEISRGRFFSEDIETDRASAVVINEAAVRMLGLEEPLGKRFRKEFDDAGEGEYVTIVGVLKDFNFSSLHNEIKPMIVRNLGDKNGYYVCLRLGEADPVRVVEGVRRVWSGFADDGIFEYSFLDDDFDALYRTEVRTGRIMSTFFVLSIVIACLGLFGLVSYSAEQKTKEIGIRKVLGASISDILVLLSSRVALLVVIANLIAWPVSYIIMERWLDNFAYRTSFHPWLPMLSAFVGLGLALFTVSYRVFSAARANPVENIRYE
ncbi:MAG TPA: FtsX-like permease family protein, partial [Candidatus Krumholzibacterium sp.]|nr:FtsX-like permease family protein [Candidatus Krumholzibacterium sp.]